MPPRVVPCRLLSRQTLSVLASIMFAACGGGITPPGARNAQVGGSLFNHTLDNTLLHIKVLWDGTLISDNRVSPALFQLAGGASVNASPGTHTLSILLVEETVTSATYDATGVVGSANTRTGAYENIQLGPTTVTLKAGDKVSFSVVLH